MDFPYGIFYTADVIAEKINEPESFWLLRDGAWLLSRITIVFGDLDVLSYIGVRRAARF